MPLARIYCDRCQLEPIDIDRYQIGSCSCVPEPMQELILQDEISNYHHCLPEDTFSATQITGCLRQTYLKRTQPYDSSFKRLYPAMRGKIIHGILEGYHKPWEKEQRKSADVGNGTKLTGQIDAYNPETREIVDYKTMADDGFGFLAKGPKKEHVLQVNIYAWLLGNVVESLTIWYVGMRGAAKTGSWVNARQGWKDIRFFLDPVPKIDRIKRLILQGTSILKKAFSEGVMPDMVGKDQEWMCKTCEVKKQCDEYNWKASIKLQGGL